jgi:hypothetical protein
VSEEPAKKAVRGLAVRAVDRVDAGSAAGGVKWSSKRFGPRVPVGVLLPLIYLFLELLCFLLVGK